MVNLKKQQRFAVQCCIVGKVVPPLPLTITITRIGPRQLDDDNLAASCKYVRDQIANIVGVDDGSPLYTWRYEQHTGKYGVDIEIVTRNEDKKPL